VTSSVFTKNLFKGLHPQQVQEVLGTGGGPVTLMFTDIENSTPLKELVGGDEIYFEKVKKPHDTLLVECITGHSGHVLETAGDSFFAVFSNPTKAVESAVEIQTRLTITPIVVDPGNLRVRIGMHTGTPVVYRNEVTGLLGLSGNDVDKAARIEARACGGQVLISEETHVLTRRLKNITYRDWGEYLLKGLHRHRIFEVLWENKEPQRPLGSWRMPPTDLSTFVGRETEITRLLDFIPKRRAVTLWGMGGIGKTRLAVEIASRLADEELLADGVVPLELKTARTVNDVVSAIFRALDLKRGKEASERDAVFECLTGRRLLLLLDNCETVENLSPLLREILARCKDVRLLATSQIPIGIGNTEQLFPVEPMPVPLFDSVTLDSLAPLDSFKLFRDRVRLSAKKRDWEVADDEAPVVAELLRLTDGIPLAIELVAAWSNERPFSVIRDGLKRNRDEYLRRNPEVAADPRHISMQTCLDWSYHLLPLEAQSLLARLAVFVGGFLLESVEMVCAITHPQELLDILHAHSFLQWQESLGAQQYSMFPTVREYAAKKLGGDTERYRQRAAEHFLQVVEASNKKVKGPEQPLGLNHIAAAWQNIRTGMDWCCTQNQDKMVINYARYLARFFKLRGYYVEGLERLKWGIDAAVKTEDAVSEALLAVEYGMICTNQGDYINAEKYCRRGLKVADRLDDLEIKTRSLHQLGYICSDLEKYSEAVGYFNQSLEINEKIVDQHGTADTLCELGIIHTKQQKYQEAQTFFERSLEIYKKIPYPLGTSAVLDEMGTMFRKQGDFSKGRDCYQQSLSISSAEEHPYGMASTLYGLGLIAEQQGKIQSAIEYWEKALKLALQIRIPLASELRTLLKKYGKQS
jgi:predicted ATPase/class 3 adenylate cyclase/Tfp pilus assembly protein PilF